MEQLAAVIGRQRLQSAVILSLLLLLLVFNTAAFDIEITPTGDKFVKALTKNAVFSCHVTGADESRVRIRWVDQESQPILENSGQRIYIETGSDLLTKKLYITAIEERDAGKYSCSVTVDGTMKEKSVQLLNFKDITFEHAPNPQHPKLKCDAKIECKVTGNPAPTVSWRFNGKPVEGPRYQKEPYGLLIRNVSQADDGNYTCRAEVEADGRYDERMITVIVHIPPTTVSGPGDLEGIEGEKNFGLSCKSDGLPSPKFEFYKENKLKEWRVLSPSDRIYIDSDLGKVSFRPLKKEDEGTYHCKALNDVGDETGSGKIKVYVAPKIHDLRNLTLTEDTNAILSCRSQGDPPPVITFEKSGNDAPYKTGTNDNGRISVLAKSPGHYELQITKISPKDVGSYICRAQNLAGKHWAASSISVHYKPRFAKDEAHTVYSWAGRVHNITCNPQGEPTPDYEWRRGDRMLENNDTFHIFNAGGTSSLQVRVKEADQSWIYGDFVCRAKNVIGHTDFKFSLSRATVPDAPQNVTVKENHSNLILLAIEPPKESGGVRLVGYRVEYGNKVQDFSILDSDESRGNKSHKHKAVEERHGSRKFNDIKIENLRPATEYTFRIRAKNEVGVGNTYEIAVLTANISRPAPIHLTSPKVGRESTHYKVTWKKPMTGGKPIQKYHIRYKKIRILENGRDESDEDWTIKKREDFPDKPILEYRLSGLTPNTDYKLEVLAENEIGSSKPEGSFYFRTSALPHTGESSQGSKLLNQLVWLPSIFVVKILTQQWTTQR